MITLYSNFIRGVSINLLEWFIYHLFFVMHQLFLFKIIDRPLYGQQGVLFALLYFTITVSTLGLDGSLAPFFAIATESKHAWKKVIWSQMALQIGFFSFGALIAIFFLPLLFNDIFLSFIFIGATVAEGLRKIMKVFLHLTFRHDMRISIELGTLMGYLAMVWGSYFLFSIPFSLYSLFVPFLISSTVSCGILTIYLCRMYYALPKRAVPLPASLAYRIISMRVYTSLYGIGHQLFSSNVLIPYIGLHFGFSQAGIWNLIQTITNTITNLMHKISGFTSQALLSHVKHEKLAVKQKTFSIITNTLNQMVYAIIVFIVINYKKLSFVYGSSEKEWFIAPLLYIGITIIEQWSLAYEKFYMNEERTNHLLIFNTLVIGACYFIIKSNYSLTTLLTALFALRLISFFVLALISYWFWGIRLNWQLKLRYFIMALIIAISAYAYLSI